MANCLLYKKEEEGVRLKEALLRAFFAVRERHDWNRAVLCCFP